ncbi:ATP-binding cassette domain-containing protein [Nonomuraea sp. JJY05]|uniref:ATP-binding cassette domain-containing protein n=1 Tax=Nonomuraea sp. JJY05 TaxID=3350255 RepID=UPI00373EE3E5
MAEHRRDAVLAVTGPSGSGKSTLPHCLAGIIRPESGEVVLDGRRIGSCRSASWRRSRESWW